MLAKAYQKYLYIPRPVSKRYPMDVQHRAKQFAPFAALRGFEEIVRKQEILYEQRKVLSEEQKCGLDRKLQMVSVGMKIQATYFKESREMKPAGQYHTICGTVEFFDPSIHLRIDDTIILIPDVCELSGDKLVTKGTYAKMARGEMVRFIAENNIENPVEIQKFDRLGYSFRSDLSSDSRICI